MVNYVMNYVINYIITYFMSPTSCLQRRVSNVVKALFIDPYNGTNIKGRVVQMMGNLHFELATLATGCVTSFMKVP